MAESGSGAVVAPARTALVTGASRGIGRAVAVGLAAAGLDVALLARDVTRLDGVAAEIRELGRRAPVLAADVTDRAAVEAVVAAAEAQLGGIDLLVNAAGVIDAEVPAWLADPDQWWATMETNVRGPFLLARSLVPQMLARGGGRIIDLASGASSGDMVDTSAYNASKTALARLGANLHLSGYEAGLRVFELSPGTVATDMTASMPMYEGRTEWTPVELTVDMAVALASGELDAYSGCFLRVTYDTPQSLRAAAASGAPGPQGRRLRITRWGPGDPHPG